MRVMKRSTSGATASAAQTSVRRPPARSNHDTGAAFLRDGRLPGTRSAPHATATPARAWPIGLGMSALSWQILPPPPPCGESIDIRNTLIYSRFLTHVPVVTLDF